MAAAGVFHFRERTPLRPGVMAGTALYRRPLVHLTAGMTPGALCRTFRRTQSLGLGCLAPLLISIVLWPLRIPDLGRATLKQRYGNLQHSLPKDIVFVIGFWRSATTLLHELLSLDPDVGFPNLIDVVCPDDLLYARKRKAWILSHLFPPTRQFDMMPLDPGRPQEDEMALAQLGAASIYDAIYFPARRDELFRTVLYLDETSEAIRAHWIRSHSKLMWLLSQQYPGKRLVVKNPAHATRLGLLYNLYPTARFVRIDRKPQDAVRSVHKMFNAMTQMLSLERSCSPMSAIDCERLYEMFMERLNNTWATLPTGRISRVHYDELINAPADTVAKIYADLALSYSGVLHGRIQEYWNGEGAGRVPVP
jgi:omega-hydroxy-beta-dihydromenaquinone-9 sulfotransferase